MSHKMVLRCPSPSCRQKFAWQGEFPRFCPVCGFDTATPAERTEVIAAPMIKSARTQSIDDHARAMMDGGDTRAELAAEMAGVPVADMADLKITDMKDNLQQGEIAAVTKVVNPVSQVMDAFPDRFGFRTDGAGHSDAVMTGPHPNAGARAQSMVRRHHSAATMGTMPKGQATISSTPALETQQPGYRPRVA